MAAVLVLIKVSLLWGRKKDARTPLANKKVSRAGPLLPNLLLLLSKLPCFKQDKGQFLCMMYPKVVVNGYGRAIQILKGRLWLRLRRLRLTGELCVVPSPPSY